MPPPHPQHHPTLEYAPPLIRSPSPASTIGTVYGEDETSFSDSEHVITQSAFEAKCLDGLGLGLQLPEEELAEKDPLIVRMPVGSPEEKKLYEGILDSLRAQVRKLEENELVERTLLRGSCAALEEVPSSSDVDVLMRSMMVVPPPKAGLGFAGSSDPRSVWRLLEGDLVLFRAGAPNP